MKTIAPNSAATGRKRSERKNPKVPTPGRDQMKQGHQIRSISAVQKNIGQYAGIEQTGLRVGDDGITAQHARFPQRQAGMPALGGHHFERMNEKHFV